jgi:NAD(P)-dependent dehydrogenase (short-subunit alcohol dehydrogenase family)
LCLFTLLCLRVRLARNEDLGVRAVKQLTDHSQQAREKVFFHQLDITNVESIRRLADHIRRTHGGLDVLINNAAIAFKVNQRNIECTTCRQVHLYISGQRYNTVRRSS